MKYFPFVLAFALIVTSCKKDVPISSAKKTQLSTNAVSYMPLALGNYWVYEVYNVDTSGTATATGRIDSLYAEKDTVIDNQTYYYINVHYSIPNPNNNYIFTVPVAQYWIKDSVGLIIGLAINATNIQRKLMCDPIHINDTVRIDTTTNANRNYYITPLVFVNDTVPAGIFSGVNMSATCNCLIPPVYANYPAYYTKYAMGVGICRYKIGYNNYPKSGFEWKLIRYHI